MLALANDFLSIEFSVRSFVFLFRMHTHTHTEFFFLSNERRIAAFDRNNNKKKRFSHACESKFGRPTRRGDRNTMNRIEIEEEIK